MKICSNFFVLTSNVLNILSAAEATFFAVSSLVGSENFYSKPWYMYSDDISPRMKMDICAQVSKSPLFETFKLDAIDPTDAGIYKILKENHPDIYESMYEEQNSSTVLKNAYSTRKIVVAERVVHEFVFSCLALDRESGNITQYFVSKVFLLNTDGCTHHKDRMKGVFVFMEKEEETVVVAVAEQPGYVVDPASYTAYTLIELEVLKSEYEEHEVKNTICGLAAPEKIRLCTLVLNTKSFRARVTFVPDKRNIDDACHRGVLRLQKNSSKVIENDDWMIGCKAVKIENDEPVTFYVSAGFQSNEQIIFCTEQGLRDIAMVGGVGCRIDVRKKMEYPE